MSSSALRTPTIHRARQGCNARATRERQPGSDSAGWVDVLGGIDDIRSGTTPSGTTALPAPSRGHQVTTDGINGIEEQPDLKEHVSGNRGPGILVTGDNSSFNRDNQISQNSIVGNGGIGIDLGGEASSQTTGDGPTLNDNLTWTGGNELLNYPRHRERDDQRRSAHDHRVVRARGPRSSFS